jgi:serine protease AprX
MDYAVPAVSADVALKYGYDGRGITVAVIDSGILDSHPDLEGSHGASRVVYEENFVTGAKDRTKAPDEYGHGTHVAGILGGDASMSSGPGYTRTFRGVAPQVRFVDLKVLDRFGVGRDSGVIAAIQRAIELKDTYDIRVINLSLGRPVFESYLVDPLCQAVEKAWKAGIVVVVAAGNQGRGSSSDWGYGTISAPGNDPYVITVGATNGKRTLTRSDDVIASYSSKGPTQFDHVVKPDLVAPGNRIIASEPKGLWLSESNPANRPSLG